MTASAFNSAADIAATRASVGKRIGEIIEDIIGDSRIRQLFDDAGHHPDEYAGKPTGLIALDKNVISKDTKNALLVAQAAERALTASRQAALLALSHDRRVDAKEQLDLTGAGFIAHDDKVFQFVGSDRDPAALKEAQSTWMLAQLYLNNEILAIIEKVGGYLEPTPSMGDEYQAGFMKAATAHYALAADMLEKEGHADAAAKFRAVSTSLSASIINDSAPSPSAFASAALRAAESLAQARGSTVGSYGAALEKLERLAYGAPQAPAAPAAAPQAPTPKTP